MRKKSLARKLSVFLAASMVATSAPATALAAQMPQTDVMDAESDEAVADIALFAARDGELELAEGSYDAWTQDEQTIIGGAAGNVLYGKYRHFTAGSGNGNSHSNPSSYPAMFVNPNSFDFDEAGYFDFTYWSGQAASSTRFGIMLGYNGPGNGMFLGFDAGGWYWQKYTNGDGAWYSGSRVAAPAASSYVDVHIEWTADKKATLTIKESGSTADPTVVFENEDFSGIAGNLGDKIAVKCGAWSGTRTDVYMKNIHYTGQKYIKTFEVSGTVVDKDGNPLSGASVEISGETAKTDENGTFTLNVRNVAGTYEATVKKAGYYPQTVEITIEDDDTLVTTLHAELEKKPEIVARTIASEEMEVEVAEKFPFVIQYNMKGDLEGKVFYGQTEAIDTIEINGTLIQVTDEDVKTVFTEDTATYEMTLKDEEANIDCVITAELKVEKNTLAFNITDVVNNLVDKDAKGQEIYPIQTIEIPNHSLISVRSSQENANLKGAKVSSNTLTSGDKSVKVTDSMTFRSEDFMYGFVSNSELSAGLWSNSEYQGTHVAAYVSAGGASNTRVMATTTDLGGENSVGLASTEWYYDRKVTPTVNGKVETYVVEHAEMPSAKVAIAGDMNDDNQIDWQDGAIAYREIMNNPYKCEEVPELVSQRIAMDFGSQAANPFLTVLDGVKRVALSTDGLGQSIILKGYGSEGHDSGHPDYGDIGKRIGGAEDMNELLVEGGKLGAKFGVHINASEMYTEAKAFSDELSRGNYGWNWLDQGIGINGLYDLASGERMGRLQSLKDQVGDNLDFIYLDVWGNNTSGKEDAWESRNIARQINSLGWRFTTEWGATQEYDSTLQHWAADLAYGGASAKGQNSEVMRFIRNHQKDSWIADYPSYNGAAQAPLLGGLNMTDFEGWQGRTSYDNYIKVMFRHNLITKFLQHYKITKWVDGEAVTMSGKQWTPEMEITLKSDDGEQTVQVTRGSNDYANDLHGYRSRTITLNGVTISQGAVTGGNGSNPGDETYLIPWYWAADGSEFASEDQKLYHWNTKGGTTTWTLPDGWDNLANVVVYKLTDEGKTEEKVVEVVDGQITLADIEAEKAYVVTKGEEADIQVSWQSSRYIYDMGFNDPDVTANRTITGDGTASIVDNASANNMLKLEGEVAVTTALTNLKPGQKYAAYIGVDNRSDAKAYMTVKAGDEILGNNYTERSFAYNLVSSDQHHTGSGATLAKGDTSSYFQNMYVFFTAPESADVTLTLSREAGDGATYFDDVRVVETKMDVVKATDENGIITSLKNDFEDNAQGIWPFVISGPANPYYSASYYVTDNRIHLSEAHEPYSNAGYKDKRVDDVLDGNWSVKINGLYQEESMIYQTIPQNFHFEPGETYYVSFDYQMGSEGTYEVRVGDGRNTNVKSCAMPAAIGETKSYGFSFTASESGQSWFGIYSTDVGADMQDLASAGSGAQTFSGYGDFILDNVEIRKAGMTISETSIIRTSAKDKVDLDVTFINEADKDKEVTWASSNENVAYVDENGVVSFTGYGSAMITATAEFDGEPMTLCCAVQLIRDYQKTATFENVWANTEERSGEDGKAWNVADGNGGTIWHSNWAGAGFVVSASNPAILTVKLAEDVTEFETKALRQRSGSNGLVQKYEIVVGDTFDSSTHTITDGISSGTITATNSKSGSVETLVLPNGAKGHYLQIRVLQGSNSYASIADILLYSAGTYETTQEKAYLRANKIEALEAKKASAEDEEILAINNEIKVLLAELIDLQAELKDEAKAAYDAVLADPNATEEEKQAAKAALDEAKAALKASQEYLNKMNTSAGLEKVVAMIKSLDASEYTAESWAAVEKAVAAAEAVLADNNAAQKDIDTALANLIAAFGDLEYGVQKLHLETAIKAAEQILALGENYKETEALAEAVEAGKTVLADQDASQEAVDNAAYAVLEELFRMAKKADISSLESLIEAAKDLLDGPYTSGSIENLKDAIDAAEAVIADQNRGDSDISDAYANLIDAIIKLEMKGNKVALKAMLIKAKEVLADADSYVASTIEGLADVTAEAEKVYYDDDAVQSEVNAAVKTLTLKVAEARLLGDVDGDGAVTTSDSTAVLRSAAELTTLSAEQAASADVNGDGAADTGDAALILQYTAEKISAFK
ncbi:MAG: endo-alpha-N-acetylgalactosaminidase family protein [Hominisplanchenecus sp.]